MTSKGGYMLGNLSNSTCTDDVLYDFIKLTKVNTKTDPALPEGAALELMAITATSPGQRLAFTRPFFTLSMRVY